MDVQDYESTSQDARDDSDLGDEGEEEVSSTL
jgi:hypothetical protein